MSFSIVEKIKALLRLSRSANRHEAELALQRAFALAQKHRIDVASLNPDEESEAIGGEYFPHTQRTSLLQSRCLNICVAFFHVEVCLDWKRVLFVGTPTDVAIAHYVYGFLCQQGQKWLSEFVAGEKKARRKMSKVKRENFIQGYVYGIAEQLRAGQEAQPLDVDQSAIVVASKAARKRRLEELVPHMISKKREISGKRESALVSGWVKGKQTTINKPLTSPVQETLALC